MAYEFKKLSDVTVIEGMKENLNVLVEDNGEIVKLAANDMIPEDVALKSDIPTDVVKSVNGEVPDENGNIQVSGLPEGSQPHQQLVTNEKGEKVWAQQLAYTVKKPEEVFAKTETVAKDVQWIGDPITELADGMTCIVTHNGDEYELVAADGMVGDPYPFYNNSIEGGYEYPFMVSNVRGIYVYGQGEHTISVTLIHETPVPMEDKYIPATTPTIQAAQPGQTIVVKAVDEDGKPTEWEAADMGGSGLDVVFTTSDYRSTTDVTVNADWETVVSALKAGQSVQARVVYPDAYNCMSVPCALAYVDPADGGPVNVYGSAMYVGRTGDSDYTGKSLYCGKIVWTSYSISYERLTVTTFDA